MMDLMARVFGPVDKGACVYFLIMSIIFFVAMLFLLLNELVFLVRNLSKFNLRMLVNGLMLLFNLFLVYFVNRILYNMCSKSLA